MQRAFQHNIQTPVIAAGCKLAAERAQADALLLPLLLAANEKEYEAALHTLLVEHAQPIICGVIKKKMRVSLKASDGRALNQDALEMTGEIQARLASALRKFRSGQHGPLKDFSGYVAVTAHHACHELLRRRAPERHSLKNKLRYLLEHRAQLSLRDARGSKAVMKESELRLMLDGISLPACSLPELVAEVLKRACAPVELDALVNVVSEIVHVKEARQETEVEDDESTRPERLPDRTSNQALSLESRLYLEELWQEICGLPQRQRAALLLNLRDAQGASVIELLPITGIASMRAIASSLEMTAEELAALWNNLPLDDAAIAERLSVTRQQVINLRKSARARLARRMKAHR